MRTTGREKQLIHAMQDFSTYCKTKKIDPAAFQKNDPDQWQILHALFDQVSPESFTQQKLYLINNLRRAYHYDGPLPEITPKKTPAPAVKTTVPKATIKPAGAPKVKISPKGINPAARPAAPGTTAKKPAPKVKITPKVKPAAPPKVIIPKKRK